MNIVGDTIKENNETFTVRLSGAVNAAITDTDGIGTIVDDDSTPMLMAAPASVSEGNTGQKMMTFAVTPTNGNWQPMTVDYATIAGEAARAGLDYVPVAGTAVIPAETTDPVYISVPVIGNRRHQKTHKVILHLQNPVESIIVTPDTNGDIIDDDPAPTMLVSDVSVGETNSGTVNAAVTVTLSNDTDDVVTVNFATADGTAIAGTDYVAQSGTLTFQPGVTSQVITIPVNAASSGEMLETFTVNLSGAVNATLGDSNAVITIVPPSAWLTTTVGEFGAGTIGAGSYVANTSGGEVTLAPAVSGEFDGTALPSGAWISGDLGAGGTTTVANGWVTVDGTGVFTPQAYAPGRTLEFVAIFTGQPSQSAGFGSGPTMSVPYAMFGVKADGLLYARSAMGATVLDTAIPGSWFNIPHRFRIDWNPTGAVYFIDGTQVATHAVNYSSVTIKPVMSDLTAGGGGLSVDWMRMSAYSASGVYTSPVYNAGAVVPWLTASWLADVPAGTTVTVAVRSGNSPNPDVPVLTASLAWTAWTNMTPGAALNRTAQFAQYKVTLTTSVPNATPSVKEVVFNIQR